MKMSLNFGLDAVRRESFEQAGTLDHYIKTMLARQISGELVQLGKPKTERSEDETGRITFKADLLILDDEECRKVLKSLADLIASDTMNQGDQYQVRMIANIIYGYEKFPLVKMPPII